MKEFKAAFAFFVLQKVVGHGESPGVLRGCSVQKGMAVGAKGYRGAPNSDIGKGVTLDPPTDPADFE